MTITRSYALRLIREGKARALCLVRHDQRHYVCITRYDVQRMDHYVATDADHARYGA